MLAKRLAKISASDSNVKNANARPVGLNAAFPMFLMLSPIERRETPAVIF
jgi:hypothetical protein